MPTVRQSSVVLPVKGDGAPVDHRSPLLGPALALAVSTVTLALRLHTTLSGLRIPLGVTLAFGLPALALGLPLGLVLRDAGGYDTRRIKSFECRSRSALDLLHGGL